MRSLPCAGLTRPNRSCLPEHQRPSTKSKNCSRPLIFHLTFRKGHQGPLESSIQAIDNTSFLVYKLQFHKGDEIQGALRQIAKDLILSNAPVNQNLLNSINSIQWLEVTNSLLSSGDQETLTRLRELIKNLDIPSNKCSSRCWSLQTSLANALTFGLEWGGNYKYRNKFATVMNNTAPASHR